MIAPSEFQRYLQSILDVSREGIQREVRDRYIPTLAELPLQVQTCASSKADSQEQQNERREPIAVLDGLRNYAPEHVLLVGKPGSGKSTSLRRLLWEEAGRCLEAIEHNLKNLPLIPVLVELRECRDGSVLRLIQKRLQRQRLRLKLEEIEDLLFEGCFLLLLDGLNELPNQDAWQAVNDFRRNYPDVPMVFTTRELGSGSGLGIAKKLEMLPLTKTQMREFVQKQLPETGGELWRQIKGRLREVAIRRYAAFAIRDIGRCKQLPNLWQQQSRNPLEAIGTTIAAIQSRCGFYNYNITQYSLEGNKTSIGSLDALIEEYYEDILSIIFNTGWSIAKSSKELRSLGEEALREIFLPAINAKYKGSATGETRNKDGKTDILVRIHGEDLLIAECKFWEGEEHLKKTLDQLLGYATVRDTQLAMLIFSRNKKFTEVKQKILPAIKQHPSFGREVNIDLEKGWYQLLISHPDDQACELTLTIMAFHISS